MKYNKATECVGILAEAWRMLVTKDESSNFNQNILT
jgi:hypothetical protein